VEGNLGLDERQRSAGCVATGSDRELPPCRRHTPPQNFETEETGVSTGAAWSIELIHIPSIHIRIETGYTKTHTIKRAQYLGLRK